MNVTSLSWFRSSVNYTEERGLVYFDMINIGGRQRFVDKIPANGLTFFGTPAEFGAKHKPSKSKKDKQISEIENQLREKLGIVVEISHSQGKKNGKIILKYSNLDVLDGLLKKLGYKK